MQILETERLRLRWFDDRDVPFILGLINEPSWKANIADPGVGTPEQARQWMRDRLLNRYWAQGHGFWCVERKSDGEPLGLCGLIHRDGLPEPDLGYGLAERHWGRGYAREAAAASLRYAHEVLGLRHLLATTAPHNDSSGRVLMDIGFEDRGLQQTEAHEGLSRVYEWKAPGDAGTDVQQIEALVRRFLGAFDNRAGRIPTVAALPHALLPDARLVLRSGDTVTSMDPRTFIEPRAQWLADGTLREFHEEADTLHIEQDGGLAQVRLNYAKAGIRDGQAFEGRGHKRLSCVKTARGWKIAAVLWEDAPA